MASAPSVDLNAQYSFDRGQGLRCRPQRIGAQTNRIVRVRVNETNNPRGVDNEHRGDWQFVLFGTGRGFKIYAVSPQFGERFVVDVIRNMKGLRRFQVT